MYVYIYIYIYICVRVCILLHKYVKRDPSMWLLSLFAIVCDILCSHRHVLVERCMRDPQRYPAEERPHAIAMLAVISGMGPAIGQARKRNKGRLLMASRVPSTVVSILFYSFERFHSRFNPKP